MVGVQDKAGIEEESGFPLQCPLALRTLESACWLPLQQQCLSASEEDVPGLGSAWALAQVHALFANQSQGLYFGYF